jgi:hypothetical protein
MSGSNRIVVNVAKDGGWLIYSDQPIEFYQVNDHCPDDRVYRMDVTIGVEHVRAQLRGDHVGCFDDGDRGPLQPSRPGLSIVKSDKENDE